MQRVLLHRVLHQLWLLTACGAIVACGGDDDPMSGADPPSQSGGRAAGGRGGSGGAGTGGSGGVAGAGGTGGAGVGGSGGGGSGSGGSAADVGGDMSTENDGAPAPQDAPVTEVPSAPVGNPFVYVGSSAVSQIRIFELDLATGMLAARGTAASGPSPNYMAFHPSGRYLYAINEVPDGRVVAFAVNPATGALTMLNSVGSGGNGPAHLSVHKSGKWVLTANYGSGHAAALPIMEDGRLGNPIARPAGAQAHMILDDGQSGKFVFVPSKGDNRVVQFRFDEGTGQLTPNDPPSVAEGGAPRHMVFHPSGKYAFLLTEGGLTVVSYKYDAATGLLSDGARLPAAPTGNGAHILLHPHKELLYTSIRAYDAIGIYPINAEGRAGTPRHVRQQLARPWDFAIDPSGKFMLVANNENATVQVFRIGDDGGLSHVGGVSVGAQPRFVGILPRPR